MVIVAIDIKRGSVTLESGMLGYIGRGCFFFVVNSRCKQFFQVIRPVGKKIGSSPFEPPLNLN
jgi:hypothetical protein